MSQPIHINYFLTKTLVSILLKQIVIYLLHELEQW